MLTAGRTNLEQHWKKDIAPTISDWEHTIWTISSSCETNITDHVHNRRLSKFKQELLPYTVYYATR